MLPELRKEIHLSCCISGGRSVYIWQCVAMVTKGFLLREGEGVLPGSLRVLAHSPHALSSGAGVTVSEGLSGEAGLYVSE